MDQTLERKLAAIMFTDIAGYTALSAKDSKKTSELLKTQRDILKPIVEKHGGSWMKEIGDGLLLTFDSATSAVECSIIIQEATKDIEDLNLRIGIHEGEVIKQDGDVIGDDVNVASRIEPFSAVGGVAISQKIQQAISSNKDFETKYIGKPKLKGVAQEVKVYCITSHGLPETDISKVSAKLEKTKITWGLIKNILFPITGFFLMIIGGVFWFVYPFLSISVADDREYDASIAILYMENISLKDKSYFADGLTEELINRLSRIQNLKVRLRTDVALYKDKKTSLHEIAKELKVNYIVEGSVRIIDDELRVNAKLFDISNDIIIWSESYKRQLIDIFSIQDEIAEEIVRKLDEKLTISKVDLAATRRKSTENLEAYNLIMKSYKILGDEIFLSYKLSEKITILAEEALAFDSSYADAWAMLSMGRALITKGGADVSDKEMEDAMNEAILLAETALLHDPDNELALGLICLLPMIQTMIGNDQDYFLIRKQKIIIDRFLNRFPETPFSLTAAGMYYIFRHDITDRSNDLNLALTYFLKSHSILARSSNVTLEPLYQLAKQQNLEFIPNTYLMQGDDDKAYKFLEEINYYKCSDDTYNCLSEDNLYHVGDYFYNIMQYEKALVINKIIFELFENGSISSLENISAAYYRYGMIYMKWGQFEKSIEYFTNALNISIANQSDDYSWHVTYYRRLGLVHYYMDDYQKASNYYLEAFELSDNVDDNTAMKSICSYGYISELIGESDIANSMMSQCANLVLENLEIIQSYHSPDYEAYETLWTLYLYFKKINQPQEAFKYLNMAYEITGIEKIKKYHQHPKKDSHPDFFYCRDIINTYESSLRD